MSTAVLAAVFEEADVEGGDLLILLALAEWANDEGVCWPSQDAIARRARVTPRWVRERLPRLIRSGHVELIHQGGQRRGDVNRYRLSRYVRGNSIPGTECRGKNLPGKSAEDKPEVRGSKGEVEADYGGSPRQVEPPIKNHHTEPPSVEPPTRAGARATPRPLGPAPKGANSAAELWDEVKATLRHTLGETFHEWVAPTHAVAADQEEIRVRCTSSAAAEFLDARLRSRIEPLLSGRRVVFEAPTQGG